MSGVHVTSDLDKKLEAEVARVLGHGRDFYRFPAAYVAWGY